MISVFVIACLFGGSAAISLPALGGAPITPAVFALPFLMFRAVQTCGPHALVEHAADPGAGLWLLLTIIWGVLSAYFMPRFFAGDLLVMSTDRTAVLTAVAAAPLKPSTTNLTQACYAIGGFCAFVSMRALLTLGDGLSRLRNALLLLAALNILAALINLAEHHLGMPSVMEYVRNGGYVMMDGGEVGGLIRISGTFPETSAFSAFTAPLFAFLASLWRSKQSRPYSGWLALISLALLAFSTSTTAYGTLLIYFSLLGVAAMWRVLVLRVTPAVGMTAVLIWCVAVAVCCVLLLKPELVTRITDFFDITVVRKLESSSGVERSSWNAQSWSNFIDTYGIGVGLGSARASSFLIVLLSNLGVIGTTFFTVFVVQAFRRASRFSPEPTAPIALAAGHAMLVTLIAASVSGTVFDIGIAFYAFAAAAAAGNASAFASQRPQEARSAHV
ncbi:hypothetical protein [Methylibium sp.]|uniref:hypothetical protein n=1 Tax=Methylibium sp. TaxID=2067992 RepID=UPI003D12C972